MIEKAIKDTSKQLNISTKQIEIVLNFLSEGNTVPFISRYRQDATGGLNEEQIYQIESIYKYNQELNKRKESVLAILEEKNILNEELASKIKNAATKSEVEAIYEPFKLGKVTKASEAIKMGLEPFAKTILENKNPNFDIKKEAQKYINEKVTSTEMAIENAFYIISQWISQDPDVRQQIKNNILTYGKIQTSLKKGANDEENKFKIYYEFSIPIKYIKNHNVLAINRGVNLKILKLDFVYQDEFLKNIIARKYIKQKFNHKNIMVAIEDSLKRLILPSIEREIFSDLFEKAEKASIQIFSNNVEKMLFAPATTNHVVLSIDPGYANGCKMAVLNENGDLLKLAKMYPHEPQKQVDKSKKIILDLIKEFQVSIIVIGNGTASRETEEFVAELISKNKLNVKYTIVSEVGASVYSASKIALKEFPDISVEERSAIHIGRKFLDPLNELIKIDPKSIGVGQYQHDLNQKELDEYLAFKVSKVVNQIGVDVNTATEEILTHVSGLKPNTSKNILELRRELGNFEDRNQIKKVKGLGAKTYEQCIGFLRIFNSKNFLDKTFIHPESYKLANAIIKEYKITPNEQGVDLSFLDAHELAAKYNSNFYEIDLIIKALSNPIKNIDRNKTGFILKKDITKMEDLHIGTEIEGTVENITDFGLFVYIGIKKSLFIHISKINLKDKTIYESFSPGEVIKTRITEMDKENNRISGEVI